MLFHKNKNIFKVCKLIYIMNIELTIGAAKIKDKDNYEEFYVKVNSQNYDTIKKKLELEREKIISIFKELEKQGYIKSIRKPRNKQMKNKLEDLVRIKKNIKKSIRKITEVFILRIK